MSRQYSPYSTTRSSYSGSYRSEYTTDDWDSADRFDTSFDSGDAYRAPRDHDGYDGYQPRDYDPNSGDPNEIPRYAADVDTDYTEYEFPADYHDQLDRRWIWVAGVAGVILMAAVICTGIILGGGDSGTVSAAPSSATTEPAAPTATATAAPTPSATAPAPVPPGPGATLPETVTTVTPTPSAVAPVPEPAPVVPAPVVVPEAPVPDPALAARTVTYHVTGNRQLLDLVTVIYTDARGALQTDVNVALPWVKTVTLDPGVTLSSVTATSVGGQLNCSIVDGSGAAVAVQANDSMIATCTR
ncbi:hypothetical protein V4U86_20135 [Mycobacterium sp. AMU20-3851]|uniref:hypothetical protein n=1 Tax=Mycobacterium sp. AMU20-3851 TaxID=3122055 RepID=UPI0037550110